MNKVNNKGLENFLFSVGGVIAMFLLLAGIYVISHLFAARVDLTEEKAYTLSAGTRAILKKLDTPVQIKYYSTQGKDMPVELKVYAQRVEDLLNEYAKAGGNNLQIKKYDPQPDTEAEEKAQFDGIEGMPVETGDRIYLGIAVSMLDATERLTFLDPRRERLLEYDLTRAIASVMNPTKPIIGVMSSLPVMGAAPNPMMMRMQPQQRQEPWIFVSELKRDFTVKEVQPSAEKIDDDINILLVIHPKNLSDKALYAIDQFVLRGGKLIAAVDPHSIIDAQNQPGMNPLQAAGAGGSSLDKLTKTWGLQFDANKVVADAVYKSQINRGQGRPEDAPAVLSLTDQAMNTNDVVTSQLDSVVFLFAGGFTGTPAEGLTQTVLVHTSPQVQQVEKFMAQFSGEQILKDFKSEGKPLALALRLNGKFKSAFPDGAPKDAAPAEGEKKEDAPAATGLKESAKESTVILIGDTDFMYDQFAGQVQNFFGQRVFSPGNGNINLIQGMVEQLAGDENLIAVRSRATLNRPFTRIKEIQAKAEEQFRNKILELEKSRDEAQRKLNELQQAKQGAQKFILTAEQQAEIEKFKETQREMNRELRQVRKNLRREVDSLENRLKLMNILGMPMIVAFAGLGLAFIKRNRTAAK